MINNDVIIITFKVIGLTTPTKRKKLSEDKNSKTNYMLSQEAIYKNKDPDRLNVSG